MNNNNKMTKINFRIPIELKIKLYATISELMARRHIGSKYGMMSEIIRNAISKECSSILRKLKREKERG